MLILEIQFFLKLDNGKTCRVASEVFAIPKFYKRALVLLIANYLRANIILAPKEQRISFANLCGARNTEAISKK